MSSGGKSSLCRICGGALMGNQRRWLFAGPNKKTPAEATRRHNLSPSLQSSPWGSTSSLGSGGPVSTSQLSLSPSSRGIDLLSVLTHILGQAVPRGGELEEFVCGKCVCVLERIFKFDCVIARVRALSSERLQKMTQERNKIRQWVCRNYCQRHPQDCPNWDSTSEEDGEGYGEMLQENMALSEYEFWSERWDACPYFTKTGKRCGKGKGCEGCDFLRVSDSDYESVCGIPRHLPFRPSSPFALSRDKSRSVPLPWQEGPPRSASPSLAGSTPSLPRLLHSASAGSLDSHDGHRPPRSPDVLSASFVLKELKGVEGKALRSPAGSRIPVLGRRNSSCSEGAEEPAIGERSFGTTVGVEEELRDVLTDLRDEFLPLHQESRVGGALGHLRGQLDKLASPVEAEANPGWAGPRGDRASENEPPPCERFLLQSLGHSLHSRERVIQECLRLIKRVCVEEATGTELSRELTEHLEEVLSDNQVALEALSAKMTAKETSMEKEIGALRKAGRDREQDLETLHSVLQCNQDLIHDLRAALGEKEQKVKDVEKEVELWRRQERALATVLQEKEAHIRFLQEHSPEMADLVALREESGTGLCEEVAKLTAGLQQYQLTLQQEGHSQTAASLTAELRDLRLELRKSEEARREADRAWRSCREDWKAEEGRLVDKLDRRDSLIQQILLDAEKRDRLLAALQQNL